MIEKKFFCDFFDKNFTTKRVVLTLLLLAISSSFIIYNINHQTYTKELSEYSDTDYDYLCEVTTTLYKSENKTFNLFNLPNNISIDNIIYDHKKSALVVC